MHATKSSSQPRRSKRHHHAQPQVLPGRRDVLRPLFQVPSEGWPRVRRSATCDREVVNVCFYTVGNMRMSIACTSGQTVSGWLVRASWIFRTKSKASCRRRSGRDSARGRGTFLHPRRTVCGRDHLGRDWPRAVVGDTDVHGRDDGDRGEWRTTRRPATRQSRR